jgi:hypothetical protein
MARPSPLWLAASSRFASFKPGRARLVLLAVVVLLLACFSALSVPDPTPLATTGASQGMSDVALYESIVDGVRYGGDYYTVAADALRAGSYPLRPFLTFRLPALALIEAHLPQPATVALLWLMAAAVALAWARRLAPALPRAGPRLIALILLMGSMLAFVQPGLIAFHEIWAAQFVALSLALRRQGQWIEAVAVAMIALLIRETAALYVVTMAAFAWFEGERREAIGWSAAFALLLGVLAAHAIAVGGVTGPLDAASPGWLGLQGPGLFVKAIATSTGLAMFPLWFAALLVGLSLFGWASWNDPLASRAFTVFALYALVISIFARLDTFYWGLMVSPVFLVGLVFAPDGLRDLVAAALDRRRVRVQIVGR